LSKISTTHFSGNPAGENHKNMKIELQEMTNKELEETEGGNPLLILLGVGIASAGFLATGVINNWEDFKTGMSQGYNSFS
jgi:hypothetical protein